MAAAPLDDATIRMFQAALNQKLLEAYTIIEHFAGLGVIDPVDLHEWTGELLRAHRERAAAAAAAAGTPPAAAEEKEKRIERLREEDENCHASFSRECRLCLSANPRARACLSGCGHVCCLACAEQMASESPESSRIACPFCRQEGDIVRLFEDEEAETDDSVEGNQNLNDVAEEALTDGSKSLQMHLNDDVEQNQNPINTVKPVVNHPSRPLSQEELDFYLGN